MHKLESRYHYNKNLYMINNAEDIVVFQFVKCLFQTIILCFLAAEM